MSLQIKKKLNSDSLIQLIRNSFGRIPDERSDNASISLTDGLMSAYAMFSLKEKSLLDFQKNIENNKDNLVNIYGLEKIPTDTHMRTMLDAVDSDMISPAFKLVFNRLQRSKELEKFLFMDEFYLVSLDGTGFFSSQSIHCDQCMEKKGKNGKTEYYHQFLGAAIVHPQMREVIALAPEMIERQDGSVKNDCERNAAKRFFENFKKDHPRLKVIFIEDGLSPNAPHIKELKRHGYHYILGVKPDDHKFLFHRMAELKDLGSVSEISIEEGDITHVFSFCNNLPLNESNQNVLVNFIEYWEINHKTNKTQHFTWVTDFQITKNNVYQLMRGGRARWKIENETFNTLKNQGYHFEHNYGHGYKNLSSNFALLMMLAFLVDQTLQLSCNLFKAALKKRGSRTNFWSIIRKYFTGFIFDSMNKIYEAIYYGIEKTSAKIRYENST